MRVNYIFVTVADLGDPDVVEIASGQMDPGRSG